MTMDFIQQCMGWNPTPLGARVAFAMARVQAPSDPKRSAELHNHAQDLAVAVGESVADRENVPALLADEEWLVRGFKYGCERAERREEHLALYPPIVWSNEWAMSLDGIHETRASVAKCPDGFLPGLEVSRLGGDCEPMRGEALPALKQAIGLAEAMEARWHRDSAEEVCSNA
jgi:hypothetical protein